MNYAHLATFAHRSCSLRRWQRAAWMPLIAAVLAGAVPQAMSKEERREPTTTWSLWGGDGGSFGSADAVIAAFNKASSEAYQACLTKECASCGKTEQSGLSKVGPVPSIVNGELNSRMTVRAETTYFTTACTVGGVTYPPQGPTTSVSTAGIAAAASQHCPAGFGGAGKSCDLVVMDGVQVSPTNHWRE